MELFFEGNPPQKIMERLLFFLFDIGVPDRQIGSRALQMRRVRRLWKRIGAGCALTDSEHATGRQDRMAVRPGSPKRWRPASQAARAMFRRCWTARPCPTAERETLVDLIRSEAEALRDRVNWLSENTDPYNMQDHGAHPAAPAHLRRGRARRPGSGAPPGERRAGGPQDPELRGAHEGRPVQEMAVQDRQAREAWRAWPP